MTTCRFLNKKLKREKLETYKMHLQKQSLLFFTVIMNEIGKLWDTFTEIKFFESKKWREVHMNIKCRQHYDLDGLGKKFVSKQ